MHFLRLFFYLYNCKHSSRDDRKQDKVLRPGLEPGATAARTKPLYIGMFFIPHLKIILLKKETFSLSCEEMCPNLPKK